MSHMRQDEKVLAAVRSLKQIGFDLVTIRKTLPALTGITHPVAAELIGVSRPSVTKTMNADRFRRDMQEKLAEVYGLPPDEIFEDKYVHDQRRKASLQLNLSSC